MMRTTRALGVLTVALLFAGACLPVDTRPPPGLALVTVSSDDSSEGLLTDDGWLVRYETFLLSVGNFGIAEGPCMPYAESHYIRILELTRSEPQKLAQVRALGSCPFIFEVRSPPADAVLGAGVTEEQKAFLRASGSDPWVRNAGTALHVAGTATKDAASVRFAWSFREFMVYADRECGELTFRSEETTTLDIHARTLSFFDDPSSSPEAPAALFEPYAIADANTDGVVTLEELDAVPLDGDPRYPTLGARLYQKTAWELLGAGNVEVCHAGRLIDD